MPRFSDRTKRIARRQESDFFRWYFMPVSWIVGLAGFLGSGVFVLGEGLASALNSGLFIFFVGVACLPIFVFGVRWLRGHFHSTVRGG